MIYLIEYRYAEQQASKSFHFVEANSLEDAKAKAENYIKKLLYYRFGKEVSFTLEKIEEVKL